MKVRQGQRNKYCFFLQRGSNIINLSPHDKTLKRLIIHSLTIFIFTSAPFPILLNNLDDSSFKIEIFDAIQLSMLDIFTPAFF